MAVARCYLIAGALTCKTLAILATKVPSGGNGSGWWYSSTTSSPAMPNRAMVPSVAGEHKSPPCLPEWPTS